MVSSILEGALELSLSATDINVTYGSLQKSYLLWQIQVLTGYSSSTELLFMSSVVWAEKKKRKSFLHLLTWFVYRNMHGLSSGQSHSQPVMFIQAYGYMESEPCILQLTQLTSGYWRLQRECLRSWRLVCNTELCTYIWGGKKTQNCGVILRPYVQVT